MARPRLVASGDAYLFATHVPPPASLYQELNQLGRGQIRASLHSSACSIFNVESLVLEQLQEPP